MQNLDLQYEQNDPFEQALEQPPYGFSLLFGHCDKE